MTTQPASNLAARSQAVATTGAGALVSKYEGSFTAVLPSHLRSGTWLRVAQAALKRGKPSTSVRGMTELEVAANNNPPAFLAALLDAARLGLEPGTDQFWLIPRKDKSGRTYVQGIVGYQGLIELMYRAGAVESVVAVLVHAADRFEYVPGRDVIPTHVVDWDAEDRGPIRLVYAFARMRGGATSQVVVLNRGDVARIKASNPFADSKNSPWTTHEGAMWLKTAVRQLAKWVPLSSEYVRVAAEADAIRGGRQLAPVPEDASFPVQYDPGRGIDDIVDAEVEDDATVVETEAGPVDPVTGEVLFDQPETAPTSTGHTR